MTDTETTTELNVDARVRGTDKVEPTTGVLWRAIAWIVGFFPTYRDTREGRKTQKQMKAVFVIIGLVLMAIGGTADEAGGFWILVGLLVACMAFVIPVEELKMRSWRSTFKKKQQPREKTRWDRGHIEYDGKFLAVYAGDDRVRRINLSRGKHDLAVRSHDDNTCVGVLPPGAKKSDSIWVIATGPVSIDTDPDGDIEADEMDRPAKLKPKAWEKLWEAIRETG